MVTRGTKTRDNDTSAGMLIEERPPTKANIQNFGLSQIEISNSLGMGVSPNVVLTRLQQEVGEKGAVDLAIN
jgi:hypothetical protein